MTGGRGRGAEGERESPTTLLAESGAPHMAQSHGPDIMT